MVYPRYNRYLIFEKIDEDFYKVKDCYENEEWEIEKRHVQILKTLDGNTNPYKIDSGMSREEMKAFLVEAKEEGLLDSGKRIKAGGFGSVLFGVWHPKVENVHRKLGKCWNYMLMLTWIPILLLGLCVLKSGSWRYIEWNEGGLGLYFIGLGMGMFFHEISHAAACIGYGGHFLEMGVMLYWFLPGAYVVIGWDSIKNRFQRAQVHAAGIESNFACAGIFLCLLKLEIFDSYSLIMAAIVNLFLGLFNMTLIKGVDGHWILQDVFTCEEFFLNAVCLCLSARGRKILKNRGINGRATITACWLIISFQMLLPLMLVLNVINVVNAFL